MRRKIFLSIINFIASNLAKLQKEKITFKNYISDFQYLKREELFR